jgi:5-keto 4-deoxyuronate isomerase
MTISARDVEEGAGNREEERKMDGRVKSYTVDYVVHAREVIANMVSSGTVRIDDGSYIATAADGIEVQLGTVGFEASLYDYLREHATPDTW